MQYASYILLQEGGSRGKTMKTDGCVWDIYSL